MTVWWLGWGVTSFLGVSMIIKRCNVFRELWAGHYSGVIMRAMPSLDCLLNRLFRRRSKKTSKPHVTGLCKGNPPVTGGFPSQRASNAEMFPFDGVIMIRNFWKPGNLVVYMFHFPVSTVSVDGSLPVKDLLVMRKVSLCHYNIMIYSHWGVDRVCKPLFTSTQNVSHDNYFALLSSAIDKTWSPWAITCYMITPSPRAKYDRHPYNRFGSEAICAMWDTNLLVSLRGNILSVSNHLSYRLLFI